MANTRTTTRSGRKAKAKKSNAPADPLAASLESTARGLETFLGSLRASGMPEALDGYRHLHVVLFQQRQWALGEGRDDLQPRFEELSAAAASIRDLLGPYVEVMSRIADLGAITADRGSDRP